MYICIFTSGHSVSWRKLSPEIRFVSIPSVLAWRRQCQFQILSILTWLPHSMCICSAQVLISQRHTNQHPGGFVHFAQLLLKPNIRLSLGAFVNQLTRYSDISLNTLSVHGVLIQNRHVFKFRFFLCFESFNSWIFAILICRNIRLHQILLRP